MEPPASESRLAEEEQKLEQEERAPLQYAVTCKGDWTKCGIDCQQTYKISTPQKGQGEHCIHLDGYKKGCKAGQGACQAAPWVPPPCSTHQTRITCETATDTRKEKIRTTKDGTEYAPRTCRWMHENLPIDEKCQKLPDEFVESASLMQVPRETPSEVSFR